MVLLEKLKVFNSYWWFHSRIAGHCWKWWCFNSPLCLWAPCTWWIISSVQ